MRSSRSWASASSRGVSPRSRRTRSATTRPAPPATSSTSASEHREHPAGAAAVAGRRRGRRRRALTAPTSSAARAHLAGVGARGAGGAEPARLRLRRRGRGRGIEGHPADPGEVHLDPRVGVEVAHAVLAGVAVVGAGREARHHPRRDPDHAQHQRHRAGELLAVAAPPRGTGSPRAGGRRSARARCRRSCAVGSPRRP